MAFQAVRPQAIFSFWQRGEFNYEAACASLTPPAPEPSDA